MSVRGMRRGEGGGGTYGSQSRVSDCSSLSASHRVTNAPHTGNASDKQTHI